MANIKEYIFFKSAIGLWFGLGSGNKDKESKSGGISGVFGDWILKIGLLLGLTVGIGKKHGVYTGLVGGFSIIPLFTIGFIGIPIGYVYKRKFGVGIVIPIQQTDPWLALTVGIGSMIAAMIMSRVMRKYEVPIV